MTKQEVKGLIKLLKSIGIDSIGFEAIYDEPQNSIASILFCRELNDTRTPTPIAKKITLHMNPKTRKTANLMCCGPDDFIAVFQYYVDWDMDMEAAE